MDRLWSILESFFASPYLWGVVAILAIAFTVSGRFSVTAANVFLWVGWGAGVFGIWRAEVILKQDPTLRYLILATSAGALAIGATLLSRWFVQPKSEATQVQQQQTISDVHPHPTQVPTETPKPIEQPTPVQIHKPTFNEGKEYWLDFASNNMPITKKHVKLIEHNQEALLEAYLDGSRIYVDAKLYSGEFQVVEIKHNNFVVRNPQWDRNFNDGAFEVVNEQLIPVLQIVYKTPHTASIYGIFGRRGYAYIASATGLMMQPDYPSSSPQLKRIFKYPSRLHQGQEVVE